MQRKRRKKFSIKKTLRLVVPLILIITIGLMYLINKDNINTYYLSKKTGYKENTINVMKDNDLDINILNKKYSETLENIINTEYFNPKYLSDYINITYHDNDTFLKDINSLLTLGYSYTEINNIYNKLSTDSINIIINNTYIKDLNTIINLSYFKEDNLDRYLKYLNTSVKDLETSITYVNIGLDNDYYTNVINIDNQDDLAVLVNKYHKLSNDYVPSDLEKINSKYHYLLH